jgi:tetratricopeptide (TPR) repeat protein
MPSVFQVFRTKRNTGGVARASRREALGRAQRAWDRGEHAGALAGFEQALRAQPADARVRLKVAQLHAKLGHRDLAIAAYTRVAEQLAADAHDEQAASVLRQLIAFDPANRAAQLRLADLCLRLDRRGDALAEYRKIFAECRESDDADVAIATLARIAELDPHDVGIRRELARRRCERGESDGARAEYTVLLQQLEEQCNWEAVVKTAEEAIETIPLFAEALERLARAKLELDQPEDAIRVLESAPSGLSDEILLQGLLAQAYEAAGDADGTSRAYQTMADVYRRRGDAEGMREILQRHVRLEPLEGEGESEICGSGFDVGPPCADSVPLVVLSDIVCSQVAAEVNSGGFAMADTSHCFGTPLEKCDDAQSHRDLAIAYMEMGAYRLALRELDQLRQFPQQGVDYRDVEQRIAVLSNGGM